MFDGAKALVAGGTGFIGMNLMGALLARGCHVRATMHERPPLLKDDGIEYVRADLTRMDDCQRAVNGVDYVFMCAAQTSGAAVMATTPLAHVTPNVVMNTQLIEAAYKAKVKKFLFISSSAAYPPTGDRPVREDEMFDGDPYETYYAVGWMKRYAEILCRVYALKVNNPMPTVVIRPSNVYGPCDKFDFRTSHVTAALIRRVVERQNPFEVWGTGNDIRDIIYVDDFIRGLLLAFESSNSHLEINIAAGVGYTIRQIVKTLCEVDGFTGVQLRFDPSKPTMIPIRLVDTSLAEKKIGFRAQVSLAEGLRKTIEWYRKNAPSWTK
jgi:GDP-L-fucose synthase